MVKLAEKEGEVILDSTEETEENIGKETDLEEVTRVISTFQTVDTKEIFGNLTINLHYEENGAPNLTIQYNTSAVETEARRRRLDEEPFPEIIDGFLVRKENCTLTLTRYGDMSSFVGHPGNREDILFPFEDGASTGYADPLLASIDPIEYTDIVEHFPCEGNTTSGSLTLNETDAMTTDLGGLAGRGLLLKIADTDRIIGFSVISPANGVPKADVVIKDVHAVCEAEEKLSLMVYSDKATAGGKTLRAHFQPQTEEVINDAENIKIEVIIGTNDPVRISNYRPDDNGCVELFYTSPDASPLFLFFLKG